MQLIHLLAQIDTSTLPQASANQASLNNILSIVFGITGSIALLVVVIGGFRYTLAHGDPNAVSQARQTIIYAVIGLVVSICAFSIVQFVIKGVG